MQPFRFAILGAAKIGANFCDAARRAEGVTVAAVASKSMERARAFAEANGVEHYYDDYAEMLDIEYLHIDKNSTFESVKRDLRINEVYYMLNKALR